MTHNESSFRRVSAPVAGEREPEASTLPDVSSGVDLLSGSRLRYVAERGSGTAGTVYNRLDWEVLDRYAPPGRQVVCRARYRHAMAIAKALNQCL